MPTATSTLKRKLRDLKKLELSIRFKDRPLPQDVKLVWDVFFSTGSRAQTGVKHSLSQLEKLEREDLKTVFEEYFYRVYYQRYQENGLRQADVYDPQLLSLLGLPPYAGGDDIKKRFRELAKKYHPDLGGDSDKFIELMNAYEQLNEGNNA